MASFEAIIAQRLAAVAGDALKRRVIDYATAELKRVIAESPAVPTVVRTLVNGTPSAALDTLHPNGGEIRFELSYINDIVAKVYELLRERAPVGGPKRTGAPHYRDRIAIFMGGQQLTSPPTTIPSGGRVLFIDTALYARKIERGESLLAPDGVFEIVAIYARRQFGNAALITYSYLGLGDTDVPVWPGDLAAAPSGNRRRQRHNQSDYRFPAISISNRS